MPDGAPGVNFEVDSPERNQIIQTAYAQLTTNSNTGWLYASVRDPLEETANHLKKNINA